MTGFSFFNVAAILAARYLRAKSNELGRRFDGESHRAEAKPPQPAPIGRAAAVQELKLRSRAIETVHVRRRAF